MQKVKTFFGNKYVQSVLVFVVIVGGYIAYKSVMYSLSGGSVVPLPSQNSTENQTVDAINGMEPTGAADSEVQNEDRYKGIHIMSDGTVMLGNGEVLEDATVTSEGMIELSDGTEIKPVMDLRR